MNTSQKKEVRVLPPRYRKILKEIAGCILPRGGEFELGAEDTDFESLSGRFLKGFDAVTLLSFKLMLLLFEYLPFLFLLKPRAFRNLSGDEQVRYLEGWERSHFYARHGCFSALKALCAMICYSDDGVEKSIGYKPACQVLPGPVEKPEQIVQSRDIDSEVNERAEVCIIGSGAGGAVVARELAEAGFDTVVLEEGGYFTREDFYRKPIDILPLLYRNNSAMFALGYPFMPLSVGSGIGGSTTINSCTCFRVPDQVLADWEANYQVKGLSPETLRPLFERVEKIINVQAGDFDVIGKNALVLKRGAEALGLRGAPIRRNTRGCKGCGICNFGCPEGAKQSMEVTYIPLAARAGAKIYADCRVDKIVIKSGKAVGVEGKVLERDTKAARHRITVQAQIIIVCCGAIMTPLLLLKNKIGNQSSRVGKNLRVHPGTRVSALFDEEIEQWKGIMQSYYVDSYQEQGIMLEATGVAPCVGGASLPFFGIRQKELMFRYKNIANVGILISDTSRGRVRLGPGGTPLITYWLNQEDHKKALKGIEVLSEIFFAAGAKQVFPPIAGIPVLESREEIGKIRGAKKADIEYIAFHPMGTCRMGGDPRSSVVDCHLESHEVKGLFISDASIFPSSLSVNPQLTIMAFATYLAEFLKENAREYLG